MSRPVSRGAQSARPLRFRLLPPLLCLVWSVLCSRLRWSSL
ncbi:MULTISPECIES: hypothetical protein [unclassified Streptomyces]|nr:MULTISPECIES: hypothetical protein [unclassified Streptomyces]